MSVIRSSVAAELSYVTSPPSHTRLMLKAQQEEEAISTVNSLTTASL